MCDCIDTQEKHFESALSIFLFSFKEKNIDLRYQETPLIHQSITGNNYHKCIDYDVSQLT